MSLTVNWRSVGVLVAVAMAVVSCGWSAAPNNLKDPAGMRDEANAEVKALTWPAGAPMPTFEARPDDRFDPGFGAQQADSAWVCSWAQDYLESRTTDAPRAAADLKTLDGVQGLTLWSYMDPSGRTYLLDAISHAKFGDSAPMAALRTALSC